MDSAFLSVEKRYQSLRTHKRIPSYTKFSRDLATLQKNVKQDLQEATFAFFMHISFWKESRRKYLDSLEISGQKSLQGWTDFRDLQKHL